ncbi:hypothetical protein CSUB01_10993 [Colletotrichum sublineola]|uniref:Uncharacterized protein n=1 Tax=Colletotrichum sublineola TaxID=1173701 RepID=A0A066XVZ1_COLSU|nr:hypothetical protein CSUB01_10993 [Colletotrichum sublineola]
MEPDNFAARTLAELPTHIAHYGRDRYAWTCLTMISTGIHKWGFVIYRCTYEDDELWSRYLAQLKSFCHAHLVEYRRAELLEQHLVWVVIEDRAALENASRSDVRKHFNQWVLEQDVPKLPVSGITNRFPIDLPLYRYCLYVDKQCLESFTRFQEANDGTAESLGFLPPVVFAVIDRSWSADSTGNGDKHDDENKDEEDEDEEDEDEEEEDEDEGGYPLIDGTDRKYVGWMYCNAYYCMGGIYETLLQFGLYDEEYYERPPAIYPGGA